MKKILLIVLWFFSLVSLVSIGFSTDISACQTINSADYYNITAPISSVASTCFTVQSDDVSINCNNFLVSGNPSNGAFVHIASTAYKNLSIYNCGVSDFDYGVLVSGASSVTYSSNITLENLSFENINLFPAVDVRYYRGVQIKNISVKDSLNGAFNLINIELIDRVNFVEDIYVENVSEFSVASIPSVFYTESSQNTLFNNIEIIGNGVDTAFGGNIVRDNIFSNINVINFNSGFNLVSSYMDNFTNINISDVSYGIYLDASRNNLFENSYVGASLVSINLSPGGLGNDGNNNAFLNSYLGNYSNIFSDDWTKTTPNNFTGNTYLAGTQLSTCFDNPTNLSCEVAGPVIPVVSSGSVSVTGLPAFGFLSVLISFIFIGFFLI